MPLRKYMADPDVTAEVARAMALAYDSVCDALREDDLDFPREFIAQKIAEGARNGLQDVGQLVGFVLNALDRKHKQDSPSLVPLRPGKPKTESCLTPT
jgi:hypothetical protein